MEKNTIFCPKCGRALAEILGEVGGRRQMIPLDGARVRVEKNALGEDLGWVKCPGCKTRTRVDPAHWLGEP